MKKGKISRLLLFWILLFVIFLPGKADAALTGKKAFQALTEYTEWIRIEEEESGGLKKLPKLPANTYGDDKLFSKLVKKRIGDGKFNDGGWYYPRKFRSLRAAWSYAESLSYRYNPYIEFLFSMVRSVEKDGRWYIPVLLDDRNNYLLYKYRNSGTATLIKRYRRAFRLELAALEALCLKKEIPFGEEMKAAAAANYLSAHLAYKNGTVKYKGKAIYAGGSIRTALLTGKGNCYDYAYLFRELCREAGLSCSLVAGQFFSGQTYYHAWNAVRVNGRWYYFDGTSADEGSNTGRNLPYNISFAGSLSRFPVPYTASVVY